MELAGERTRVRLPSLQLLDAHHHVDVTMGVLLEDVANVVGFPGLLEGRRVKCEEGTWVEMYLESISSDDQLDFSNASNHAFVIVGQS